ncbi:MAG: DUF4262 domain-containing protein [Lysobacter sp.]|nr:DUF4262 domain-containing protein [Lysobacter sp.]
MTVFWRAATRLFLSTSGGHFGEYLGTAMRCYQEVLFDALVMFLPDRHHRFPWDQGYDGTSADESLAIV